jgi:hypothetical protein
VLIQQFDRFGGRRSGTLHHLLLRYTQALITQMAQTAACNRHHSVDQQLCRWLLLSLNRLDSNQLNMTQELIANMLGVRREGVTEAAGKLQRAGLIEYNRGHITVLDRPGLEARVCECYQVVKTEFDRPQPPSLRRDSLTFRSRAVRYRATLEANASPFSGIDWLRKTSHGESGFNVPSSGITAWVRRLFLDSGFHCRRSVRTLTYRRQITSAVASSSSD